MKNRSPEARRLHTLGAALCVAALNNALAATGSEASQVIVVTATRHAMALLDAPAAMTVVTGQQIAERGAANVFEALRGETGISLQGRAIGGRNVISLRGMEGRHTLYLVDGKRIGASDGVIGHTDFQYDWVAVDDIERVEVVRGPMSVLYGSEALGGVVNVITRRPGDRWSGSAVAEGQVGDLPTGGDGHRVGANVGGRLAEGLRMSASVVDTRRQAATSKEDPRLSELEGRRKQDAALRLWWAPLAGHEIQLEHLQGAEERWAAARERSGARRYYDTVQDVERSHSALTWRADWAGAWQANSQLRAYGSSIDVTNTRTAGVAALRPNALDDRVIDGQLTLAPARGQLLTGGIELRDEKLFNDGLPGGGAQARHEALYGQAEIEAGAGVALTAGLRQDRHELFGSELSPRIYAVWRAAPSWTLKGGVGHGFKAPTLKQISPNYREDEGPNTYFGNASLVPETSDSAEIGVAWDSPAAGAQFIAFRSQVENLIVPTLQRRVGTRWEYLFENLDHSTFTGLEAETALRMQGGFLLNANYTYLDARDSFDRRLEKRPRHSIGMRLGWNGGPWRSSLDVQVSADQLLASPVPGQGLQPVPTLTRVGAYFARDLGGGFEISAGVSNLTELRLVEESPLFTGAEAPRSWRLALRGRW